MSVDPNDKSYICTYAGLVHLVKLVRLRALSDSPLELLFPTYRDSML